MVMGIGLNIFVCRPTKYFKYYCAARRKLLNSQTVGILNRSVSRPIVNHRAYSSRGLTENRTECNVPYRLLFFGTDDFSVESLKILCNAMRNTSPKLITKLDVVTCMKSKTNSVRTFATQENLTVYNWPPEVNCGEYDMGLVVSFGHLIPEKLINSFRLGMLNVHASLLPKYRGAAPIIYAILNGDTETGVTIMKIKPKRFDVGDIIKQTSLSVSPDELMPQLSSRLARLGASLLLDTITDLSCSLQSATLQPEDNVSYAPRVTSAISRVDWLAMSSQQVYDLARALHSLYPISTHWHGQPIKLLGATRVANCAAESHKHPGHVEYHRNTMTLRVLCTDMKWVAFNGVTLPGKKPMTPIDFYNGYISKREESERKFS